MGRLGKIVMPGNKGSNILKAYKAVFLVVGEGMRIFQHSLGEIRKELVLHPPE